MKLIVTFGLLLAAFASCGLGVNAQAAKDYCEALGKNQEESYPEFMPTCECTAGDDDTYTLTCEDGCDSCDANQTCGLRSFTQVIDSQGGSSEYRNCFEFTTSSFEGDVICYETTDGAGAAPALQQKKFASRNDGNHPLTRAFLRDRSERTVLHHKKVDQERLESQCRISVNGEDCTSCENRFTECGLKGENYYLYANCTNNDIDSIVDDCRSEGFDGILLPFFTAVYRGTCKNGTVEPGDSMAAESCKSLATEYEDFSDFKTACECIPIDQGLTYTLSCEDNCQSCNEGEDCGMFTSTELVDPSGLNYESMYCFEHTEGDFEGDKVCFGLVEVVTPDYTYEQRCTVSVNDNECKSCEYVSQSCGLLGYYSGLHADCTNVAEINGMVDECHNEGFESGGVLLPLFTSSDVGICSGDGNATDDPTDPSEELCYETMGIYNESESKTTCECIAGSDNTTYTLSCQDLCEVCDPETNICGVYSFTELIDAQYADYAYGQCFEYTQGSFKGNKVCTELSDSDGMQACSISANGEDCSSCEYQDKMCGQQGYEGLFFTANCINVVDIGVIVDECSGAGLGDDDILGAYYNAYEVGSCNITGDQQTEPPETKSGAKTGPPETTSGAKTEPPETTSGAKRDSQMVVSSLVVAALLYLSLVA